ncbi:MAG: DUF4202 domain-containing protein [Candidatus Marinimicrobia bacterium]|nr:DUF4202 domain-containing protein [Candidatus Neomarinimicrobiota bacterium]
MSELEVKFLSTIRGNRIMESPISAETNENRFCAALEAINRENAADPRQQSNEQGTFPVEALYSERMTAWVRRLSQHPTVELLLAARAMHICRWMIPRDQYPKDRRGYRRWRTELQAFHARKAGDILRDVGYAAEVIGRVSDLIMKTNFPRDPESQTLEDATTLIFLEYQFADLSRNTEENKMIRVLQKTWAKMSPRAHDYALNLNLGTAEQALIHKALETT